MKVDFKRLTWENYPSTETPLNADNLNRLEEGVAGLYSDLRDIEQELDGGVGEYVAGWLNEHVDPVGSAVVVDDTLTIEGAAADAKKAGDEISNLKDDLNDATTEITSKLRKIESNNYAKSDSDVTAGYVTQNGVIYPATSLWYTNKIPVVEGDVVRLYTFASGAFTAKSMRFVCAYNSEGQAVSASGTENTSAYTVPAGIVSVVLTSAGAAANVNQLMITRNYEASEYEPYFDPYYLATYDFIEDAIPPIEIPKVTSAGYNMINLDDLVTGYYYGSGIGSKILFSNLASYRAAIIPVEPNTDYYVNTSARFWAFTDDNDIVVSYGESNIRGIINSGSGTKFYFSQHKSIFDSWANYGASYAVIISKGNHGVSTQVKKPEFISGITQNMMDAKYGCSLPKTDLYFTVGFEETWYTKNMIALEGNLVVYGLGGITISVDGGTKITPVIGGSTGNGYWWNVYDERLAQIAQQSQLGIYGKADNLSNCTALVIGDSTVEQNRMTQGMLDLFGAREKTLTLLGTRGTAPNLHEGRAGWSAYDYCSVASKGSVPNLFFNPTTNKFDFSYYMSNQGYNAVDFVVIQLGINDLYNRLFMNSDSIISATVDYVSEIIASIKAWNADQKILLNLPTALNDDQKKQYGPLKLIRNMFVRYNEAIQLKVIKDNKIRCSYCHLILDPTTDIYDDVHPTAAGYQKMAAEVVSQINCWQQV